MSKQAMLRAPKKRPKARRFFICEEAFDYQIGGNLIAVVHPVSSISFAIELPAEWVDKAVKKAIWAKFQELRQRAATLK